MGFWSNLFGSKEPKLADRTEEFSNSQIPEITSEQEEEGFVDLVFGIRKIAVTNNAQSIGVVGLLNGRPVSFTVQLGAIWKPGHVGNIPVYSGSVRITSTGDDGNSFIHSLADLYGVNDTPSRMAKNTEFTAISLHGFPADLSSGPVKLKLFYEPEDEAGYAEVYANFDLSAKKFYFNEKDPEYRSSLLRAFYE